MYDSKDKLLFSSSADNSIKINKIDIWNKKAEEMFHLKNAHENTIKSIKYDSNKKLLISSSFDKSMKVFLLDIPNKSELELIHIKNAHKSAIWSMEYDKLDN